MSYKLKFKYLRWLGFLAGLLAVPLLLVRPAHAAGVIGNGTAESCTEATFDDVLTNQNLIRFDCGSTPITITFTKSKTIASDVTIDGGGLVTLSGGGKTRLFVVNNKIKFNIQNLTVTKGDAPINGTGGAVINNGELSINNSFFTDNVANKPGANFAAQGGAISSSGILTITDSVFSNNYSLSYGSVMYGGKVTIINSTFSNNRAALSAGTITSSDVTVIGTSFVNNKGGVINSNKVLVSNTSFIANDGSSIFRVYGITSDVAIDRSTFINNNGYNSGGAVQASGVLTITNSTFSNNRANLGGAISAYGAVSISNSTFFTNKAISDPATKNVTGRGGAIYNTGKTLIINSTFARNSAELGGAIFNDEKALLVLRNTILTDSISNTNCRGAMVDGGYNWQFPGASCGDTIPTADPKLGSLVDNGGATLTMALLDGSPAINNGNLPFCPITDQRGFSRTGTCDAGAFEYAGVAPPTLYTTNPADLVAQLRRTPDRSAANEPSNLISYSFNLKNTGTGRASGVTLRFPFDNSLVFTSTNFSDNRTQVSLLVTNTIQPYLQVSLPALDSGQAISGTLIFHPAQDAKSNAPIFTRYTVVWNEAERSNQTTASNAVRLYLNSAGTNRDESGGAIQAFDPSILSASDGASVKFRADFYAPNEVVNFWYNDSSGAKIDLGSKSADENGNLEFEFTVKDLAAGAEYSIAGWGTRSNVSGTLLLTIT